MCWGSDSNGAESHVKGRSWDRLASQDLSPSVSQGTIRRYVAVGPFPDQLSFEFRQSREEREDQLSAGGRRVDAGPLAGEHPDTDVPVVEVLHQVDEMAETATEAIEPPDRRSRLPAAPP